MKDKYKPYLKWGLTIFLTFVCCSLFFFIILRLGNVLELLRTIRGILSPIIWGIVIAYLLWPLIQFIRDRVNPLLSRWISSPTKCKKISLSIGVAISLALMIFFIVFLLNMVLPELIKTTVTFINHFDEYTTTVESWVTKVLEKNPEIQTIVYDNIDQVMEMLNNWLQTDLLHYINVLAANLTSGVISFGRSLLNFIIGIIVSIYLVFSVETFTGQFKKILYAFLSPEQVNVLLDVLHHSDRIFGGFISGKIIDSLIIGVICFVVLSIVQMPYTILISVIVGVTNVIPFFGPFIGAVPSAFLILLISPKQCLIFIIFIVILQQIDGNIIGPTILGDSTGLSSFWIIFSILLGGGLFGFAGMILGVPVFGVIYYIIKRVVSQRLTHRKLPTGTDAYSTPGAILDPATRSIVITPLDQKKSEKKKGKDIFKKDIKS
jgi:predicted PurR-regulated permease PerM